jgi:hypothetical protein
MDLIFWGPWFVGFLVFVIWIKQPICEFKQMWIDQQRIHKQSQNDDNI